jgi:arylsulfatase A-like enzyme
VQFPIQNEEIPVKLYLLLTANVVLFLAPPVALSEEPKTPQKPNILFIMADDLGPEWLSCYGSEAMNTPHLDALAKGGMRFVNAYSMPKCTPTRVTLLTGTYPFRHGWIGHWDVPNRADRGGGFRFDAKHYVTFARAMKSAGYVTAAAGKWQINDFRAEPHVMQQHGFDEHCM